MSQNETFFFLKGQRQITEFKRSISAHPNSIESFIQINLASANRNAKSLPVVMCDEGDTHLKESERLYNQKIFILMPNRIFNYVNQLYFCF